MDQCVWRCPICETETPLFHANSSWICPAGHCFDTAKSGYVHLLPVQKKRAKNPGDNAVMIQARRNFLDAGYYAPLRDALAAATVEFASPGDILLDAGCGEGYYTSGVFDALTTAQKPIRAFGVDIAKVAVDAAAKRLPAGHFAVASVYHLPVLSDSCSILMDVFAPFCREEYLRILKKGGYFLMVIPGPLHLWEMKCAVYDTPYENVVQDDTIEGFTLVRTESIDRTIHLDNPSDIRNLFQMTPYYYKTGRDAHLRLEQLDSLTTQISFRILQYQKQ